MLRDMNSESVQNRFTAYLVVAVTNKRILYMEKRKKLYEREVLQVDLLEKNYLDFDMQYHNYIGEQTAFILENWERFEEWLLLLDSEKLLRAMNRLKERDRKMLFARVFGELTFVQIGEIVDMEPKQAEARFYYILRKLKKELEVDMKNEI